MSLNRRDFLKTTAASAAVAGTVSVFTTTQAEAKIGELQYEGETGKWMSSTCQGCTSWCPIQGLVVDGKVVKVRGNPNSPSMGRICPRPHLAIQQVYDPDRVKTPLKRTNPKKGKGIDPKFVPISWDEAINTIAEQILGLIKAGESHKFVLMRGRYTHMNEILYNTFPKLIGSPNNISHASICAKTEKFGRYYTEGFWDYADFDLDNTRYILGWGTDMVSSNRQIPWFMNQQGYVKDRAKITIIDPRLSATAAKADRWAPIIPGTDSALAVAIAHVILSEGRWNKSFVGDFQDGKNYFIPGSTVPTEVIVDEKSLPVVFEENHTYGVVAWWNLELKERTPEWAEKITGISAKDIRTIAREFSDAGSKAISWVTTGASMQIRGAYASLAAHALNGLVGSVDAVGGTLQGSSAPSGKTPDIKPYLPAEFEAALKQKKIDQRGTLKLGAFNKKTGGGVVTQQVADSILTDKPYDVKVAIGYWNNFVFSINGANVWEKAMEKLPFYAHITTHLAEMSMYADIVLPAKMHMFERYGFSKNKQNLQGYLTIHQPLVKSFADAKTDETEIPFLIAQALAKKGFDGPLRYFQDNFKDPESGKAPTTPEEFDLYAVKQFTKPIWSGESNEKGDTINSWNELLDKGVWKTKKYKIGKKVDNFATETKKFEFYSETLKKVLIEHAEKNKVTVDEALEALNYTCRGELGFVPHYEEAVRHGDEKTYPFIFAEHRSRLNREGRSQNAPWYYEIKDVDPGDVAGKDVTKINPLDGKKLGLKDGDKIKITSVQGSIESEVKLWEGIRPGVIVKCYGQGHWAFGRVGSEVFGSKPRGANNNNLHVYDFERMVGSTPRHGGNARVKIEKI
ncbi:molybdopterin-dependent oxidoreductase [Sulfurospirillum barnesii]|uniref:Anaerobic dehydrogenase, typically selenocysteine-containing n=1 Tax=Sulfurospirillum barnesii (strain ATCC 700032 / DSM 10660 / SES-3) TaxID=760154 RepID=I3Y0G2_SULBS|nr:molybdopterin-dependent oxidoreductase [Sulfurospirillum barnesii]AFL69686.1 anaerobic dehydrogenase, typically selenocysteine-containing [Sulfurospirillum barnesii SES-3]